jgi:hypothetical protein
MEDREKPPFSPDYSRSKACALVENAQKEDLVLRILGGLAVRLHSQEYQELFRKLDREIAFADVDLITHDKSRRKLEPFFNRNGFNAEPRIRKTPAIWAYRQIYVEESSGLNADIFFDKIEMSHLIDLSKRLEVDSPTIPIADILLAKLQIHAINEKDIKDAVLLIRAHSISDSDKDSINAAYIAKLMSQDWGFCHTVTNNLKKTELLVDDYKIDQGDKEDVKSKINQLLTRIEDEPKTSKFKFRAKIGERKKWYNEVDEAIRDVKEWQ